jgi:hypothetical protein
MKDGVADIIGKTIINVVVAANSTAPKQQVFIVFSDGTYFEFYGEKFTCTSCVDRGDLAAAIEYTSAMNAKITAVYPVVNAEQK